MIRDFEFAYNRCIKDISVAGPVVTVNAEWERVGLPDGTSLYYNITTGANPVNALPAATGSYVGCAFEVEKEILCEVMSPTLTNTFIRIKVYDTATGLVVVSKDFNLDETTAYTVTVEANVVTCGRETTLSLNANQGIATNGTPIVVPTGIRSFTVANLGLAGDGFVFADFTIAGVLGSTTVHRNIAVKTWSVSEDQDGLTGPFTITPAAGHFVDVTWVA